MNPDRPTSKRLLPFHSTAIFQIAPDWRQLFGQYHPFRVFGYSHFGTYRAEP